MASAISRFVDCCRGASDPLRDQISDLQKQMGEIRAINKKIDARDQHIRNSQRLSPDICNIQRSDPLDAEFGACLRKIQNLLTQTQSVDRVSSAKILSPLLNVRQGAQAELERQKAYTEKLRWQRGISRTCNEMCQKIKDVWRDFAALQRRMDQAPNDGDPLNEIKRALVLCQNKSQEIQTWIGAQFPQMESPLPKPAEFERLKQQVNTRLARSIGFSSYGQARECVQRASPAVREKFTSIALRLQIFSQELSEEEQRLRHMSNQLMIVDDTRQRIESVAKLLMIRRPENLPAESEFKKIAQDIHTRFAQVKTLKANPRGEDLFRRREGIKNALRDIRGAFYGVSQLSAKLQRLSGNENATTLKSLQERLRNVLAQCSELGKDIQYFPEMNTTLTEFVSELKGYLIQLDRSLQSEITWAAERAQQRRTLDTCVSSLFGSVPSIEELQQSAPTQYFLPWARERVERIHQSYEGMRQEVSRFGSDQTKQEWAQDTEYCAAVLNAMGGAARG